MLKGSGSHNERRETFTCIYSTILIYYLLIVQQSILNTSFYFSFRDGETVMEITIIIVVAVMITIIASLMIVRSRRPRRTRPEVPGSNRTALPPRTGSQSLLAPTLSASSV